MESLLSLQTPNTFLPPPPGIPIPYNSSGATVTVTGTGTSAAATACASTSTSNAVTTTTPTEAPIAKLVPKPEPFDEFISTQNPQWHHQVPHHAISSTPTANGFPNSQQHTQNIAFSETLSGSEENGAANLYSEFCRVSDLFQKAFAEQLGNVVVSGQNPDSRAIVPVTQNNNHQVSSVVVTRKLGNRRKELVRITDLGIKDDLHFRTIVRRTRMVYDSLRVFTTLEDENRGDLGNGKRQRGDLRAASLMRRRGLWLNRDKRVVGAIPGIYNGDLFLYRMELCVLGLHGQIQAGIDYLAASMSPNGEPIATSVIVSGGYEDDEDGGDIIIYTGHGGQDKNHSRQVFHQKLEGGNLALERSMHYGIEVRVIRGIKYEGSASTAGKVYVYDGLYRIVDCWFDVGLSGFGVYKYKLWRINGQPKMGSNILKDARAIRKGELSGEADHCLSADISDKKEKVPVRLFNDIDNNKDPLYYEYLARTTFPPFVFHHQSGKATGCDCVNGCADGCFCAMKNGGEFPYNQHGILVRGKPLIFECGPFCRCPPNCRNRITQKGLKNKLEVFRSKETGWGVRSLDVIHAGAFICEYTGVVLTREQAQILTMNGDALIYPNRFSNRWEEWGDLSQIYSNYVRPSYPSIPPLDFSMDVSRMRNVACYMSHSPTPNMFVQFVLYDHNNLMFPHLMIFAMENIPPMRDLCLDYGVADEWAGKLSICN